MLRKHVTISGHVQGVYFRLYTQKEAQATGVTGWVRNRRDGRVEAVFEGEREKVEKMVAWCRKGSPYAQVEDIEITTEEYKGEFSDFQIIATV